MLWLNFSWSLQFRTREPSRCKFLRRYLSAVKDRKSVPLMQGTANVSLKEKFLQTVTVPLPPLAEQQRIVAHLDAIEARLTRAKKLREEQDLESACPRSAFHNLKHPQIGRMAESRSIDSALASPMSSQTESYTFR